MGVTVFNDKYVRVTRAWNNQEHQHYVPIKKSLQAALREAAKLDKMLAREQAAFFTEQSKSAERIFSDNGRLVGLRIINRQRPDSEPRKEWTLRIKVPGSNTPFFSNISISKHGFEEAFEMAIQKICEWQQISPEEIDGKRLKKALRLYRQELKR